MSKHRAETPERPVPVDVSTVNLWGPPTIERTEATAAHAPRKPKPWGLPDVGWAVLALVGSQVVTLPVLMLIAIAKYDIAMDSAGAADQLTAAVTKVATSGPGLVLALFAQWLAFVGVPALASYRKGHRSLSKDFGLWFKKSDLPVGFLIAIGLQLFMAAVSWSLSKTSLDRSGSDNTSMVTDHVGLMLVLMIFAASIAAPVTEELFFRGLILRAFLRKIAKVDHAPVLPGLTDHIHNAEVSARRRRYGIAASVLLSSVFFGLMHFPVSSPENPVTLAAQIILVSQTGFLGLIFALIAIRTRRIGLCIAAHLFFNSASIAMVFLVA